MPNLIML